MKFILSILFLTLVFSNEIENPKQHKIGIFHPYTYNYSENIEIKTYPIYCIVIPNLSARIKHNKFTFDFLNSDKNSFFSNHSIYIPTTLFNLIKREGMGGVISPEFADFPFMMSIKNEFEIYVDKNPYEISIKSGFSFGYSSKKLDRRTTIDLPIVFPRMQIYYNKTNYNFNCSIGINKNISKKWDIFSNINCIIYPSSDEKLFIENKSLLIWNYSKNTEIQVGYKLVYGQYPFGDMVHLLPFNIIPIPLIDIVWSW